MMLHMDAAFDENIKDLIDDWKVPGLGIAVIQGDQVDAKVSHVNIGPKHC